MERLRRQYDDRENKWGEKWHGALKKRGELLRASESKFEALVKQRDEARKGEIGAEEEREKEVEALQAKLAGAAKKEEEAKRELGRVLGDLSHTREDYGWKRRRRRSGRLKWALYGQSSLQAEKKKEAEDVEMGGHRLAISEDHR